MALVPQCWPGLARRHRRWDHGRKHSGLQSWMRPQWPTGLCWDVCSAGSMQDSSGHVWPQPLQELPGHAFRMSLAYIRASGEECEISPEQELSLASTTEIFSRTTDSERHP